MIESAECPLIAREQAEALYREIDGLPRPFRRTIVLHYFGRPDSRRNRTPPTMPGRYRAEPPGTGMRQATPRTHAARLRTFIGGRCIAAHGAIGLGERFASGVRNHQPGCCAIRGEAGRGGSVVGRGR